jgi:hypothetical protein
MQRPSGGRHSRGNTTSSVAEHRRECQPSRVSSSVEEERVVSDERQGQEGCRQDEPSWVQHVRHFAKSGDAFFSRHSYTRDTVTPLCGLCMENEHAPHALEALVPLLADWLETNDLFVLYACLPHAHWTADVLDLIRRRMRVARYRLCRQVGMSGTSSVLPPYQVVMPIFRRTFHGGKRCKACGVPTNQMHRVCYGCADDPSSSHAMFTRRMLSRWMRGQRVFRPMLRDLRPAGRLAFGRAFVYWKLHAVQWLYDRGLVIPPMPLSEWSHRPCGASREVCPRS